MPKRPQNQLQIYQEQFARAVTQAEHIPMTVCYYADGVARYLMALGDSVAARTYFLQAAEVAIIWLDPQHANRFPMTDDAEYSRNILWCARLLWWRDRTWITTLSNVDDGSSMDLLGAV